MPMLHFDLDELFLHQKTMTHEDQRNQNGSIEVIDDDLDYCDDDWLLYILCGTRTVRSY